MKGFELHKTGARVSELLERHYVVPTLISAPNENTNSWADGIYIVTFRIGEFCRVRENEEWVFYRLQDIDKDRYIWVRTGASELPDMSNYYTRDETDKKNTRKSIKYHLPRR